MVVGSANFPEDELLAQIYVDALQGKGVKVTPKFNIGAREVYYPEIEKGAVTIIPEYNGALLTTSVDPTSTAASTEEVNAALKAKLPSSLEILNSSSAEDKDSITVTQATATKDHLTSISDLTPYAKDFIIGGPPEFKTRADGLVGLQKVYGLTFKSFSPLDESGPITIAALASGKVQAADLFTTTPQIITDHFLSLADPKNMFAAQNVTPLVYKSRRQLHHREHAQRGVGRADHRRPGADEQGPDHRSRQLHPGGQRLPVPGGPEVTSAVS